MRGKRGKAALAICLALILSLTACGVDGSEEETVSVQESEEQEAAAETPAPSTEIEEEDTEEEPEEEELLTYVEKNGLVYCDPLSVKTKGMAMASDNHDDYIMTEVSFELSDILVEDAEEEGYKTVRVTQEIKGYRWFDGNEYKTYVLFPSAVIADAYTGLIVPNVNLENGDESTDEFAADIEWDNKTFHLSYYEESKWEDEGKWERAENGYVWNCAAYVTLTINIPDDYDGLTLLLPPVLATTDDRYSYQYIMDYYAEEDFYLFKINTNAETEDKESNAPEESAPDEADSFTATTKLEETKTQATKQEETKNAAPKQAHSHSYVENVTANPTCSNAGSKTFTCSCGDSYTESIPATGEHQWVENTEVIHHDEIGHNESTPIEVNTFHCRGCGGVWNTVEELRDHGCDKSLSSGGFYYTTETTYKNEWVVDQEAWDEPITSSICSVCGAIR